MVAYLFGSVESWFFFQLRLLEENKIWNSTRPNVWAGKQVQRYVHKKYILFKFLSDLKSLKFKSFLTRNSICKWCFSPKTDQCAIEEDLGGESKTHVYKLSHCSLCDFLQKRMQHLFFAVFERDICQTGRSKEITLFMKHFGTWKSKLLQKLSKQSTKGCNLFWRSMFFTHKHFSR